MKRPATPSDFVQMHLSILTAYSRSRRFRPWFVDPDEYLQTLVLNVLSKHDQFRPGTGTKPCEHCGDTGCSTWLGWRARRVASDYIRSHKRDQERLAVEAPVEEAASIPTAWGSHHELQRKVQVAQVLRVSNVKQRDACMTVLAGCDGEAVHALLGIKLHGRNYRLRRLAEALNPN